MSDQLPREREDELLAKIGIPADSGTGINDYCARRGWVAEPSNGPDDGYPRPPQCISIYPVRADNPTKPDPYADRLNRACFLPDDDTKEAGDRAIVRAARAALAQAIATLGF
jgi:hypothetical protein